MRVPTASAVRRGLQGLGVAGLVGAGTLAYAGLYEVDAYRLRRVSVPVLPAGSRDLRVLHLSDIHMTPAGRSGSAG